MTPIRDIVADYMQKHDYKIAQFADYSGMNPGTLSRLIQGSKPIAFNQLVQVTQAMGLSEDYFFDRYVHECVATPSLRRIRPFILRCAKLERLDCIERLVYELLEDNSYVSTMFEIAEELYSDNLLQAAKFIYLRVSEAERYQHSERLALCRYRLFVISLGTDLEANYRAAMVFEDYVNRLDEMDQLDALKHLINVFAAVHDWKRVDRLAQEILRLATMFYGQVTKEKSGGTPSQPMYYYILYAWLVCSNVCEENRDYQGALEFVALYSTGESWIREDDEQARRCILQFKEWGEANALLYRMMSGEAEALQEYADYIASYPNEISYALCFIVQAANKYNYIIEEVLERFHEYILFPSNEQYNEAFMAEKYTRFLADLAVYQYSHRPELSIKLILDSLKIAVRIHSVLNMLNCMTLFEQYRDLAEPEELKEFKNLSMEVHRINAEAIPMDKA